MSATISEEIDLVKRNGRFCLSKKLGREEILARIRADREPRMRARRKNPARKPC